MSKTNRINAAISALISLDQTDPEYVNVASEYREEILSIVEAIELSSIEASRSIEHKNAVIAEQVRRIAQLECENSRLVEKNLARSRSLPDRIDAIEDFIERFKRGMNDLK